MLKDKDMVHVKRAHYGYHVYDDNRESSTTYKVVFLEGNKPHLRATIFYILREDHEGSKYWKRFEGTPYGRYRLLRDMLMTGKNPLVEIPEEEWPTKVFEKE
jgi:hypothetical protein